MWKDFMSYAIFFLLLLQIRGGKCLRLLRLTVPSYKMRGEMALLECDYELEGERLYAVKWYKDDEEFYRHVPWTSPSEISYKVEGVVVNEQLSNGKQVVLAHVTLRSSGRYKCEVSAEAPSFSSANKEARMQVIYFPSTGPFITGAHDKQQFFVGEEMVLNCTSPQSFPATNLDWYINDVKVPEIGGTLRRYPPKPFTRNSPLYVSVASLRLLILSHYFKGGHMRLKCVSSLPSSLFQADPNSDDQNVSPLLEQREATLIIRSSGSQPIRETVLMLLLVTISIWI